MVTDKSHITNKNQREVLHIKQETAYSLDPDSELIQLFKGEKDGNCPQLLPSLKAEKLNCACFSRKDTFTNSPFGLYVELL